MDDLRASFDEERYPNRYVLNVPDRQGRQVFEAIKAIIAEEGIDARATHRINTDDGTLSWDIGIAAANLSAYAMITRQLDRKMHGWAMEHIEATHGEGHPLNRYLAQLREAVSPDELVRIAAEFSAKIDASRRTAIDAAYADFASVRAQWADQTDDPHLAMD